MREFETIRGFPVTRRGCKKKVDAPQRDKDTVTDQRAHKHITRFAQNFSEYEPQIVRFKQESKKKCRKVLQLRLY